MIPLHFWVVIEGQWPVRTVAARGRSGGHGDNARRRASGYLAEEGRRRMRGVLSFWKNPSSWFYCSIKEEWQLNYRFGLENGSQQLIVRQI